MYNTNNQYGTIQIKEFQSNNKKMQVPIFGQGCVFHIVLHIAFLKFDCYNVDINEREDKATYD